MIKTGSHIIIFLAVTLLIILFSSFLLINKVGVFSAIQKPTTKSSIKVINNDAQSTSGNPATRCATDSDCVIKTTYNCCGGYPRCFNKDYEPDIDTIKKRCEESGLSGPCGYTEVVGCECNNAECININKQ